MACCRLGHTFSSFFHKAARATAKAKGKGNNNSKNTKQPPAASSPSPAYRAPYPVPVDPSTIKPTGYYNIDEAVKPYQLVTSNRTALVVNVVHDFASDIDAEVDWTILVINDDSTDALVIASDSEFDYKNESINFFIAHLSLYLVYLVCMVRCHAPPHNARMVRKPRAAHPPHTSTPQVNPFSTPNQVIRRYMLSRASSTTPSSSRPSAPSIDSPIPIPRVITIDGCLRPAIIIAEDHDDGEEGYVEAMLWHDSKARAAAMGRAQGAQGGAEVLLLLQEEEEQEQEEQLLAAEA